jgi:hypothetical protein
VIYTIEINMMQEKIVVHYGIDSVIDVVTIDFSKPDGFKTAMRRAADSITADLRRAGAV